MLLPGDSRTRIVRTLSIEGLGEFTLQRTEHRMNEFPWKRYETSEWLGKTPSGARISLDSAGPTDGDPEPYVVDRVRAVLGALPDLRRQAAEQTYEGANDWESQTAEPGQDVQPVTAESFAKILRFDGLSYLRDNEPDGDIILIYFRDEHEIFGGHSIECTVSLDGRITQTDLVG